MEEAKRLSCSEVPSSSLLPHLLLLPKCRFAMVAALNSWFLFMSRPFPPSLALQMPALPDCSPTKIHRLLLLIRHILGTSAK
jgi:hypothetical protein